MDTNTTTTDTTSKRLGAPSKFSSVQIDAIVTALKAGSSIAETAKLVGVSESSVTYYKRKAGLTVTRTSTTGDVAGLEGKLLSQLTREYEKLVTKRAALVESFNTKRDEIDAEIRVTKEKTRRLRSALGVAEEVVVAPESAPQA